MSHKNLLELDKLTNDLTAAIHKDSSAALAKIEHAKIGVLQELFELCTDEQQDCFLKLNANRPITDENIISTILLFERTLTDMHRNRLVAHAVPGMVPRLRVAA